METKELFDTTQKLELFVNAELDPNPNHTPYLFVAPGSARDGAVCAYDIGARRTMVLPLGQS